MSQELPSGQGASPGTPPVSGAAPAPAPTPAPAQPAQPDAEFSAEFKPGWVPSHRLAEVSQKKNQAEARTRELESALNALRSQPVATPAQPTAGQTGQAAPPDLFDELGLDKTDPTNLEIVGKLQKKLEAKGQPAHDPELRQEIDNLKSVLGRIVSERDNAIMEAGIKAASTEHRTALGIANHELRDAIIAETARELESYMRQLPPGTPVEERLQAADKIIGDRFRFHKEKYDRVIAGIKGGKAPAGGVAAQLPGAPSATTEIDPDRLLFEKGDLSPTQYKDRMRAKIRGEYKG